MHEETPWRLGKFEDLKEIAQMLNPSMSGISGSLQPEGHQHTVDEGQD